MSEALGLEPAELDVVVGLIEDDAGRVLVNQRLPGRHMAGYWEFPGGKRHAGEAPLAALKRELAEELGIEVLAAEPFMRLAHDYGDRRVALSVWAVRRYSGLPRALEGQPLRWLAPAALAKLELLPADAQIVEALAQSE
jgi:8-oxo-dGTP diphosphatase